MTASGALSRPQTPAYWVMFLQTKVNEQIRPLIVSDKEKENYICQMCSESFILKYIFCNSPAQKNIKWFEEKVPGKVGECIL